MADLGQFSLLLAQFLCSYAVIVDLLGVWRKDDGLIKSGRNATVSCMICLTVAMAALWVLLIKSDFSVIYVAQHTSIALPLEYKISALWAGAAGSLLLWLWMQVGFIILVFCRSESKHRIFAANARAIANLVSVFFLYIMVYDKNPFALSAVAAADGAGLNPLLQHPAMVLHPPTLFVGYAGFAVPFAWAFALVKHKETTGAIPLYDRVRNWILWAWVFLTIGIVLGAWWAYEELGWGGYWAWDPVENSSLMPWFTATAMLHCSRTFRARSAVSKWLKVLSIITFSLCIFGTFLTRYGLVSSVHAFPDQGKGIYFMILLIHIWLIAAYLFVRKYLREKNLPKTASTRGMKYIFYNNYIFLILTFVVLIGTLFPFLSGLVSEKQISLKPGFFTKATSPFGILLVLFIAICPYLLRHGFNKNWRPIGMTITATIAIIVWLFTKSLANLFFVASGFALISLTAEIIGYELKLASSKRGGSGQRRNLRWYGARVVHVGVVMSFIGIAGSGGYGIEEQFALRPGQSARVANFKLVYDEMTVNDGPNFTAMKANISVYRIDASQNDQSEPAAEDNTNFITVLKPAKAVYPASGKSVSEVSIRRTLASDLYLALTAVDSNTKLINLRVLIKPLINWIWIGGILMTIGAFLVLAALYTRKHKTHS